MKGSVTTTIKIKVKTWNFVVGRRFYGFKYKLWVDGKLKNQGAEGRDHSRSPKTMKKYLQQGYGNRLITEREMES